MWLGHLVLQMLGRQLQLRPQAGVRLRLLEATVITRPGSTGVDWRLHLGLDLGQMSLDRIEGTGARGGETLARFMCQPDEILIADRGLGFASSLGPVLEAGARLVVRLNWQNLPLFDETGERFAVVPWLQQTVAASATPQEITLQLPTPQGTFPIRLVADAIPQQAADRARQRIRHAARKKGRTPDERSLAAAGFLFVLTNLPPSLWSPPQVLCLYRLRWQIELAIKRLKSLLHLDHLRAQDADLAQTYLLAKLLAALLVERLHGYVAHSQPLWFTAWLRPLSLWRLCTLLYDQLCTLLKGPLTFLRFMQALPNLGRYFRNAPRQRPQQDAPIRNFLAALPLC